MKPEIKIKCNADMGALKIFDNNFSAFFSNGMGDGSFTVTVILDPKEKRDSNWNFVELLEVKKEAWISFYDCGNLKAFKLPPGRYFIFNDKNKSGNMLVHRFEQEVK